METVTEVQPQKYQYSKPSLKGRICLNTEQAKFFAGNRFDNVMTALFIIDVTSRKLAQKLKTFDHKAVVEAVVKRIEGMEQIISAETERLEAFLKANNRNSRASYSSPLTREFDITSPEIKRISTLLQNFDNLIVLIDTVWLEELIDSAEAVEFRAARSEQMKKLFRSLVGLGQGARARAYASKVAELKADIEKAEAQAEQDKADRAAEGFVESPDDSGPDPLDALESLDEEVKEKPAKKKAVNA